MKKLLEGCSKAITISQNVGTDQAIWDQEFLEVQLQAESLQLNLYLPIQENYNL